MEIRGYKAFNKERRNRYGKKFYENETYIAQGEISFGTQSQHGFHMCKNLADVFRYFDVQNKNISVAKVVGSGNWERFEDEYYDCYEMYAVEQIYIEKFLTEEEIIEKMLKDNEFNNCKFLMLYPLNKEDKIKYLNLYHNNLRMLKYLLFYQYNQKEIFKESSSEVMKKVRLYKDGQNSN